ncbi:MAG: hypothetical protein SFZ24_11875 [Planctomycetota bacterium]|nr:hypothetical protein [Planctomycetota bacterium]
MFATDRDLLVLEPRLFFDVSWTAQKLFESASGGAVSTPGDTLTVAGAGFDALRVGAGMIALVGTAPVTPLEVIARTGATTLSVSRLRAATSDEALPAPAGTGLRVVIHTFAPQIGLVHAQLLRLVGIDPDHPPHDGPSASSITNPRRFALAEALGALHLIFASAAALTGESSPAWARAQMYAQRFREERSRLVAELDLDGDGLPEVTRRPNVLRVARW